MPVEHRNEHRHEHRRQDVSEHRDAPGGGGELAAVHSLLSLFTGVAVARPTYQAQCPRQPQAEWKDRQ
jgi:hypothetical protein